MYNNVVSFVKLVICYILSKVADVLHTVFQKRPLVHQDHVAGFQLVLSFHSK